MIRRLLPLLFALILQAQERIVTLSPALGTMVCDLGACDALVGVSSASHDIPASVERIGGYFDPNIERIFALRPTLVLAQSHHAKTLSHLAKLGIRTQQVALERLDDIPKSLTLLGTLIGRTSRASELIADFETALRDAPKVDKPLRTLIIFGAPATPDLPLYIASPQSFIGEMPALCGARNAYEGTLSQPRFGREELIAAEPDRIVLISATPEPIDMKAWRALPLRAAQEGHIIRLVGPELLIPSTHTAKTLHRLCEALRD
ncbi:MAG: ABC transporter substrate-binding protein [Campylobacterales bacterium]|nr:ABC transporter substrate-binding protein [Campylobacterales bacterium]